MQEVCYSSLVPPHLSSLQDTCRGPLFIQSAPSAMAVGRQPSSCEYPDFDNAPPMPKWPSSPNPNAETEGIRHAVSMPLPDTKHLVQSKRMCSLQSLPHLARHTPLSSLRRADIVEKPKPMSPDGSKFGMVVRCRTSDCLVQSPISAGETPISPTSSVPSHHPRKKLQRALTESDMESSVSGASPPRTVESSPMQMKRPVSSHDLSALDHMDLNSGSSVEELRKHDVPGTAELCGLQAILPRQSGVRIVEKLGEGTFGKVVLAINRRNRTAWNSGLEKHPTNRKINSYPSEGDRVVLKCVRRTAGAADCRGCVHKEVRIHSMCEHPHIVKMFGHYDNGLYCTLILRYINGKELNDRLGMMRTINEKEGALIAFQIIQALCYLHRKGIVHRDLNPRNVLLTSDGSTYLIDLGLATDNSDPTEICTCCDMESQIVGTSGYIAPEIYHFEKATEKADMFSFGIILYEMVFGFKPFISPCEVMHTLLEFPDESYCAASECVKDLISKCLAKRPDDRMSSSEASLHPWFTMEIAQAAEKLGDHENGAQRRRASVSMDGLLAQDISDSNHQPSWNGELLPNLVPFSPQVLPMMHISEQPANLALSINGIEAVEGCVFPPLEPLELTEPNRTAIRSLNIPPQLDEEYYGGLSVSGSGHLSQNPSFHSLPDSSHSGSCHSMTIDRAHFAGNMSASGSLTPAKGLAVKGLEPFVGWGSRMRSCSPPARRGSYVKPRLSPNNSWHDLTSTHGPGSSRDVEETLGYGGSFRSSEEGSNYPVPDENGSMPLGHYSWQYYVATVEGHAEYDEDSEEI